MLLRLWSCWVLAGMVFVPTIEGDFIKETAVTEDIVGQVPCTSWVARRAYKTCREDITLLFALSLSLPLSLSLSLSLLFFLSRVQRRTQTHSHTLKSPWSLFFFVARRAHCAIALARFPSVSVVSRRSPSTSHSFDEKSLNTGRQPQLSNRYFLRVHALW